MNNENQPQCTLWLRWVDLSFLKKDGGKEETEEGKKKKKQDEVHKNHLQYKWEFKLQMKTYFQKLFIIGYKSKFH